MAGFISRLFDDDEYIIVGDRQAQDKFAVSPENRKTAVNALLSDDHQPTEDGVLVGLNPMLAAGVPLQTKSVAKYRNLLFEIDDITLSPEQQLEFFQQSGLPFTTAVFSGGKSLHVIVSLKEPLPDLTSYKKLHSMIRVFLDHPGIDAATDKPALTTKISTGIRLNKAGKSKHKQQAYYLGERISLDALKDILYTPAQLAKWYRSPEYRKFAPRRKTAQTADRTKIGALLTRWLADQHKTYDANGTICRCPACADEGKDNDRDNFKVWDGEKAWLFNCVRGCDGTDIINSLKQNYEDEGT